MIISLYNKQNKKYTEDYYSDTYQYIFNRDHHIIIFGSYCIDNKLIF